MTEDYRPWGMEHKPFLLLMHLSQLVGFVVPLGNVILPLVMWITNKDQSEEIDRHGKVILNWVLSAVIYGVICFVLTFILIGALGFAILALANLIFIVIGAIKANDGILWHYPLSIKFFKV